MNDIETLSYVVKIIKNLDDAVEIKNEINGLFEQAINDFEQNMKEEFSSY